jgi:TPR repeat protein
MNMSKSTVMAMVVACVSMTASAELVRCTSKDGKSSVIRRDKCDSPDDIRAPVAVRSPTPPPGVPAPERPARMATDNPAVAYKAGDYVRARQLAEPLARGGSALAQMLLSDIYKNGRGVPKDEPAAYYWARKAGDQGDARGQALVAAMMQAGSGTSRDDAGAVVWLEKSAQQGYAIGQAALGSAYLNGQGVAKSEEKARFWLRKAAAQGDEDAIEMLKKLR